MDNKNGVQGANIDSDISQQYDSAVTKIVYYTVKNHPEITDSKTKELSTSALEYSKAWLSKEEVIGLSRAIEDWKINPVTPQELNDEGVQKSIAQSMEQYKKNPSLSSKYCIETIIEYAEDRNLKIPKSQIAKMQSALEEKTETVDSLVEFVDRVAKKQELKGLGWYRAEEPVKGQPIFKYQDTSDVTRGYIIERERKDTKEKFYAAYRIDDNNKAVSIKTSDSVDVLKSLTVAYYTGIAMNEVRVEKLREYAQKKEFNVPDETLQKWHVLLSKGESEVNIKKFIDRVAEKKTEKVAAPVTPSKEIGLDI